MPTKTKPTIEHMTGRALRARFPVQGARVMDEAARTVEVAFSSDRELEQWWKTYLILEHTADACDLARLNNGACVLFNHNRNDYVGVVVSARIDADGKGRAVVRFGQGPRASEIFRDVVDGIIRHVSVGFEVHEIKLVETRDDETDVYRATKWEPYEISFVTIPMDDSVGVGRDHGGAPETTKHLAKEERAMPLDNQPPDAPPVNVQAERDAARKEEQERAGALLTLGREYNAPEEAARFIREGKSPDQFRAFLLEAMNSRQSKPSPDEMNADTGMTDKDIARYSFVKVLRALDPNNPHAREAAAFELECSRAAEKNLGRQVRGIVIPPDVLRAPVGRAYTSSTSAAPHGGDLVATNLLAGSFIEMLQRKCLLMQLSTNLGGLVGNVDIPKQVSGATAYVVGEETDVTGSEGDFGQVSLTPYTIGALSEVSRRLLMQATPDVESIIRLDLARAVGLKIDSLGFYGTGTDEPTGIKYSDGVNAVTFATSGKPTWAELVQMESEVAADDADVEAMAYLLNARMRGHCKTAAKFDGTDTTIWEKGNTVNGYKAGVTNQVADADVFFGNFGDMFIGMWGGLELTLDPYTRAAKGGLRIVAMQDVDIALRHGESFTFGTYTAG